MSTTHLLPLPHYFWNLSLSLNPILFIKSYLTQLTSLMPALPLSLILLLFPQLFILTILFFPLFLFLTIMQFFSQFLFLFLFLALTNPPAVASGSTTKLTNSINSLLSSIPWNSVLSSDLDSSWLTFKSIFLQVMKIYIPSKLLPLSPLPPWINRALISKIRLRQRLYLKAKSSSSPSLSRSYCSLRNSISSSLKKSKASFFHSLSYSSPSKFWSFVKSLRRSSSSIPPLYSNGHCY